MFCKNNCLLDFSEIVFTAGLIGLANEDKSGLMPANMTISNKDTGIPLNFNECKSLWRMFCSYGGTNAPVGGGIYWGFFNIGYSWDWLVQIACGSFSDGVHRMYRRIFHSGTTWTAWTGF